MRRSDNIIIRIAFAGSPRRGKTHLPVSGRALIWLQIFISSWKLPADSYIGDVLGKGIFFIFAHIIVIWTKRKHTKQKHNIFDGWFTLSHHTCHRTRDACVTCVSLRSCLENAYCERVLPAQSISFNPNVLYWYWCVFERLHYVDNDDDGNRV